MGMPRILRTASVAVAAFALAVAGAPTAGAAGPGSPAAPRAPIAAPAALSSSVSVDGEGAVSTVGDAAPYAPSRLIVRFRSGRTLLPGTAGDRALVASRNVHLVETPPGMSVAEAVARYRAMPSVVYAEPDFTVEALALPNDPSFGTSQWDMTKISAPAAWDVHTNSSDVVVAVVDTGIAFDHPDLAANVWSDPTNPAVHGYTCTNGTCVAGGYDDHGHGTHVAGTIGADTDNGLGVAGLNWDVKLLAVKFLSASGSGSISDAVAGFELLRNLKIQGVNIRVTNNSWGGGGYSQALKDAMAALENGTPSTLNVCAAGNSGVNADFSPMYPAAYDNRGIVSVLASDSNDAGAGFTNYGTSSVDIAAPGVGIYSTEATGTCSLCDATGYRSLSGTSMASPHVAGVAAAMLSMHPELTAAQARDAILRPESYDALTDARGRWTSTGGRLNFAKVLGNTAFFAAPVLNQFPTVAVGPDVVANAGGSVNFTQTSSDPDGDTLRATSGRGPVSDRTAWLFGWMANQLFPTTLPFTAPALARVAQMPYDTAVTDNRGGGASGRNYATVLPTASPGGAPTGVLTVPATGTVNVPVTFGFVGSDPEGLPIAYDVFVSYQNGTSGMCCYTGTSFSRTFGSPGVYRVSVQAIDRELNLSPVYSGVISIDGATGVPPIASAVLSADSGPAPLTVSVDLRGSTDPDGTISTYYFDCATGWGAGNATGTASCTFSTPGTYWLLLHVSDNTGLMGVTWKAVVVTPAGATPPPPGDTTAPTVSITNPTSGASVSGSVTLRANAADELAGSGVKEVQYYLDAVTAGASLGIATVAPYSVAWNAGAATYGPHTVYAVARDNAGNASAPTSIPVTRPDTTVPTVSITSPSVGASVTGAVAVAASASDETGGSGVKEVQFYLDGTGAGASIGIDATAPFTATFDASSLGSGAHTVYAVARDNAGNASATASRSVTRPDTVAPTVGFATPTAGSSVAGTVTLSATASDDAGGSGVKEVQYYLDAVGSLSSLGIATSGPTFSLSWNAGAAAYGSHTVYAVARDNAGNASAPAALTVFKADATAPTVRFTAPAAGTNLAGTVTLTTAPADETGGSGIREVEYFLDSPFGTSLGTVASAPTYALSWNTAGVSVGSHTVYAVARDYAGNASIAASVAVTVGVVFPVVTLSGPTNVAKKGTATFSAAISNTPTYGVSRVELYVAGALVATDTSSPYSFTWKAPASSRTVTVVVRAYDAQGNFASSNVLSVKVG